MQYKHHEVKGVRNYMLHVSETLPFFRITLLISVMSPKATQSTTAYTEKHSMRHKVGRVEAVLFCARSKG